MSTQIISDQARKAIHIGYDNHWRFRVVGKGEIPKGPIYKDEWVLVPVIAPEMGKERLNALQASGIRFKGFVIAHEAPRLLSTPASIPKKANFTSDSILPDAGTLVSHLVAGLIFCFSLLFQAVLLDPALIVILEDETWLEVMTWYE